MYEQIHSLGRFGTGRVSADSGSLNIISKDIPGITRVFRSDSSGEHTTLGRGWGISLSDCERARMNFEDGRLISFVDANGRCSRFYYSGDMLSCISAPEGSVFYDYNADKMLVGVSYPGGQRVYISYQDVNKVHDISIKDKSGRPLLAVSYMYGLDGRIEYVYEYGYCGDTRVEKRFTDISQPSRAVVFSK